MEMLLNNIPKPTKEDEQICIATTHINLNKKFIKLYIIKYKGFEKKKKTNRRIDRLLLFWRGGGLPIKFSFKL